MDRKTAQSMCEKEVIYSFGAGPEHCIDETQRRLIQHLSQGGFIAEVTTKKEMVNLQLVFENRARKIVFSWLFFVVDDSHLVPR